MAVPDFGCWMVTTLDEASCWSGIPREAPIAPHITCRLQAVNNAEASVTRAMPGGSGAKALAPLATLGQRGRFTRRENLLRYATADQPSPPLRGGEGDFIFADLSLLRRGARGEALCLHLRDHRLEVVDALGVARGCCAWQSPRGTADRRSSKADPC